MPIPDRPLTITEVLEQELEALTGTPQAGSSVFTKLHRQRLRALCLSGGGIRSATFALGVMQGLARKGLLDQFDYLSTVSGGGYIGGWLSSWIARASLPQVIEELRRRPKDPLDPEPAPIRHLRSFSNFLTPRLGVLSADSWTLVATYLRNLLLNWLVFVPPLIALLSLPLLLTEIVSWQPVGEGVHIQYLIGLALGLMAAIGSIAAVRYVHLNRPRQRGITEGTGTFDEMRGQREFLRQCLFPMLAGTTAVTICWAWGTSYASPIADLVQQRPAWLVFGALGAVVHLVGWLLARGSMLRRGVGPGAGRWRWLLATSTGFTLGVVASWLARLAPPLWDLTPYERGIYVWLAVPVLFAVILLSSHLYVGYTSTKQSDAEREWSARFTAWVLICISVWVIGCGLVIVGPAVVHWILDQVGVRLAVPLRNALALLGGASGIAGARVGRRTEASGRWRILALWLAAVFIAWLVIVLSSVGREAMALVQHHALFVDSGSTGALLAAGGITALLLLSGLLSGWLIDTNMFSLHAMYRSRLIRAYLGASRPEGERDPNPFTGFDDNDNIHLRDLWPRPAPPGGNQRPLHIIGATLNLVSGEKLAWQERKAESFTFSPLHCGSLNVGYRATQDNPRDAESAGYAGSRGVSLGTAMAISGAAASPEMGYHSSPVLSLLLTFFNVRLGWWLGNPGEAGRDVFRQSSPSSSLSPIIDEAFGRTTDRSPYVYLSDGGHFENLGLYEMVLRRCHTIVVVDATADPGGGCSDLGNAIRKIRIDFGIPIDIEVTGARHAAPLRPGSCAIGAIRYACVDPGAEDGVLIYIKPAVAPDDPPDVQAYARVNPTFPHESITDQWFTESQFESYRQLGAHIIEVVVPDMPPERGATMEWMAVQARKFAELR